MFARQCLRGRAHGAECAISPGTHSALNAVTLGTVAMHVLQATSKKEGLTVQTMVGSFSSESVCKFRVPSALSMSSIVEVAKVMDADGAALYAMVAAAQCSQAQSLSSSWSSALHEEHRAKLVAFES